MIVLRQYIPGTGAVELHRFLLITLDQRPACTIEVLYNEKNALDQILRCCKDSHMSITSLQTHSMDHHAEADYAAEVYLRGNVKANVIVARIQLMPGVVSAVLRNSESNLQKGRVAK